MDVHNSREENDTIDLNNYNFTVAFRVVNISTHPHEPIHDPDFVEFGADIYETNDGEEVRTPL